MENITVPTTRSKKIHDEAHKQETQEDIEKVFKAAWALVQELDRTIDKGLPQKLASIVKIHAKAAAVIAALIAWVPAVGPITAIVLSAICIWSMYLRINIKINLTLGRNLFKTLISGIASNIAANIVGIALAIAISFIPVIGSIAADVIMIFATYAVTLGCGIVYLKVLTRVFKARKDPVSLSLDHLKEFVGQVKEHDDVKPCIDDAKAALKEKAAGANAAIHAKILERLHDVPTDSQKQLEDACSDDEYHSEHVHK